jgi:protein required for attachment to host cells
MEGFMKRLVRDARIVVVDGAKALVLRNQATPPALELTLEREFGQHVPPSRELGSDVPPRAQDSMGRRSAMDAPDYHQQAEDRFVAEVTKAMADDLAKGLFTQLAVVAPPLALAVWRKHAAPALAKATLIEIDKDLTKHSARDIAAHLAKALEAAPG